MEPPAPTNWPGDLQVKAGDGVTKSAPTPTPHRAFFNTDGLDARARRLPAIANDPNGHRTAPAAAQW